MKKTLAEIAELVGGEVVGDNDVEIYGVNGIQDAQEGELTFLGDEKFAPFVHKTQASAVIVSRDSAVSGKSIIRTDNPSVAFTQVVSIFYGETVHFKGVHAKAFIDETVVLGKEVAIGPGVVIEAGTRIGDHAVIYAGTFIGADVVIGCHGVIYPQVTIREKTVIGDRVIIHSGAVVGSDGFGYEQIEGQHKKIPQVGYVCIEDDVEIGANVTIDRARLSRTLIGRGTKIDNLVQIAHNVQIGENCLLISQVGVSGSSVIERGAILAGQVGVAGHITIGEGAIVAAQGGVTKSVPAHTKVSGYPAKPHEKARKVNACVQRLPHYVAKIQALEKRIQELERKLI